MRRARREESVGREEKPRKRIDTYIVSGAYNLLLTKVL